MSVVRSFLIIGFLIFSSPSFSQEEERKEYVPAQKNMTWELFEKDFSDQTDFFFSYPTEIISQNSIVNFNKERYSLNEALNYIFLYSDISYTIHKNVIILKKANRYSIKGEIVDASDNSPLAYATLTVESMNKGAITDENGRFNMDLKEGNYTLKFFCFGYYPIYKKITVSKDLSEENIQLTSMVLELDPVQIGSENPINKLGNIDFYINNKYFQNYSDNGVSFSDLPGEITYSNGNTDKGFIKIKTSHFIRGLQFSHLTEKKTYLSADSISSFIQIRDENDYNLTDMLASLHFKKKDSLEKTHLGFFYKKRPVPDSSKDYWAPLTSGTDSLGIAPTEKDFEEYITLAFGNISPFYYRYRSFNLKKKGNVFLSEIIKGKISVYNNPEKVNTAKFNDYINNGDLDFSPSSFFSIPKPLTYIPALHSFRNKPTHRYTSQQQKPLITSYGKFYIYKNQQLLKIGSGNYRKHFLMLFGDCEELIQFVKTRKKLKRYKNMFSIVVIYNYLKSQEHTF